MLLKFKLSTERVLALADILDMAIAPGIVAKETKVFKWLFKFISCGDTAVGSGNITKLAIFNTMSASISDASYLIRASVVLTIVRYKCF